MNDILNTIYNRRAVRKYKNIPIEQKVIEQLIDAGRMAPSAMNLQPWKFYVLTDKKLINDFDSEVKSVAEKVFKLAHGVNFLNAPHPIFHEAPVVIFIAAPKQSEWAMLDIGMCAQNMMLAAKSLGLESCPVGLGKFAEKTSIYSLLNISPSEHIVLSIIIGYGDEQPQLHERRKDNVVYVHPEKWVA